jgi:hypothetical protein
MSTELEPVDAVVPETECWWFDAVEVVNVWLWLPSVLRENGPEKPTLPLPHLGTPWLYPFAPFTAR